VTRANQRFALAVAVLTLNALMMAALIYMALLGKQVSGENILYMAVGSVTTWGGNVLAFFFGTSESSVHKTEIMERAVIEGEGA